MEVHFAANQMPTEAVITLQEAIAQWSPAEVGDTLHRTISDLQILHYRAPAQLRPLIDLYLRVLVAYANADKNWVARKTVPLPSVKRNAIEQLDALDKKRAEWRLQLN